MPWRGEKNSYRVWVSETLLQQTRVAQGTPFFLRFVERFPDVQSLAAAKESEVLAAWQGLGYYSRARNMHRAAQIVCKDFGGELPQDYRQLLALPGIGPYTAAAVASIAFNQPVAAIDGNVYRVLSRLFAKDTPINSPKAFAEFHALAQQLVDTQQPGDFNQAMMELGATVCTPRNPDCAHCPVSGFCMAYVQGTQQHFPVKLPKTRPTEVHMHYWLAHNGTHVLLHRRNADSIWKNMYELVPAGHPALEHLLGQREAVFGGKTALKHQLTHRLLQISIESLQLVDFSKIPLNGLETAPLAHLDRFALPAPFKKIIVERLPEKKIA